MGKPLKLPLSCPQQNAAILLGALDEKVMSINPMPL